MTHEELLDLTGTDEEIAAQYNAAADRYAPTKVTLASLADILPPTAESIAVLDALIADASLYVEDGTKPTIAATLNQFINGTGSLDLGNLVYRDVITTLVDEPGPLTAEAAAAILGLAPDTHGGDIDAAGVAAVREAKLRADFATEMADACNAAAAVGVTLTENGTSQWADVRAAMLAEFDARAAE